MISADLYQLVVSIPLFALSCHGWGSLLVGRGGDQEIFPVYAPVLGSAALLAAGGFLAVIGAFIPAVVFALLLAGAGLGAFHLYRSGALLNFPIFAVLSIPMVILLLFAVNRFNLNDDNLAYIPLALDLLAQGTVNQPFCLRAGINPNGQAIGAAYTIALGGLPGAALYDVIPFAFSLVLWTAAGERGNRLTRMLVATGLLLAPYMAWNSAPTVWIAGGLFAVNGLGDRSAPVKRALFLALIIVAGFSLRTYWLLPLAGMVLILFTRSRLSLRGVAWATFFSWILVLPYLWLSFLQFKTPAALLHTGTLHPEMVSAGGGNTLFVIKDLIQQPVFLVPVILLVSVCLLGRRFLLLGLVAVVTLLAVHHANALTWHYSVRFLSGIWYGAIAVAFMTGFRFQRGIAVFTCFLCILLGFNAQQGVITTEFDRLTSRVQVRRAEAAGIVDAQAATAPGTIILSFVGAPLAHDFRRNRILLGDVPGGLEAAQWTDWSSFREHAKAIGADFLMLSDPNAVLSGPRYFPLIEDFLEQQAPFHRGRWTTYQIRLKSAVEEAMARDEGFLFNSTYLVPIHAADVR